MLTLSCTFSPFNTLACIQIDSDVMAAFQSNGLLVSRTKTFAEININFLSVENHVFHLDMPEALSKLYGSVPDPDYPAVMGQKLASLCITLNEYPSIRYQGSSPYCRAIATVLHQTLTQFKRQNADFVANGDEGALRDRGHLLILDRSCDTLTPLMHEYTYQTMVMDLLDVENGLITYKATTGRGTEEKQALLGENDHLWSEMKYNHIAKVIETVRGRMNDIIQTSAVAQRGKAENTSITKMAAAVRELPEYQQTMSKLGQHVDIAQRCMNVFTKDGLLNIRYAVVDTHPSLLNHSPLTHSPLIYLPLSSPPTHPSLLNHSPLTHSSLMHSSLTPRSPITHPSFTPHLPTTVIPTHSPLIYLPLSSPPTHPSSTYHCHPPSPPAGLTSAPWKKSYPPAWTTRARTSAGRN